MQVLNPLVSVMNRITQKIKKKHSREEMWSDGVKDSSSFLAEISVISPRKIFIFENQKQNSGSNHPKKY